LVVDDELSIRETFQAFLEDEGYDVTVAADFFEAESFLAEHSYDVVVLDIVLPRVSGLNLLRRVRQVDESIPVIMITGEPDVSTAAESVRHGAYDYIAKPVTQKILNRVVGRAVEKKRLLDDKRRLEAENRAYQAELEKRVAERTAELKQRNQELATLIEIGRDASATLDLTRVLIRVTQRTAQVCGAHRCTIFLLSEDGETLTPLMSRFSKDRVDREMWRLFQTKDYPVPVSQVPEMQRIIRQQRPLFTSDALASSLPMRWIEPFGIKSLLGVPMISNERVVGVMWLDHVEEGKKFTAGQVDLAVAIGAQAAVAIENARLHGEVERQLREMTALHETALDITAQLDMPRLLDAIIVRANDLLGGTGGLIRLYDPIRKKLVTVTSRNLGGDRTELALEAGEGVSGKVFQTGEPLIVDDYGNWTGKSPQMSGADIKSVVSAPLRWREQVIGLIGIMDNEKVGAFDERDLRLLVPFANQAAIAIGNTRLFAETNRRLAEMRLLQVVAQAASSTLDFDEVLTRTIETLHSTMGFPHLAFVIPDEQGTGLKLHPSRIGYPGVMCLPLDGSVSGRVYQNGAPQIISDVREVPYYFEGAPNIRSALIVPVKVADQVVAVLNAESPQLEAFDEDDLRLFTTIAGQLGVALDNARLYQRLETRTAELSQACEELQEINRLRTELIQNVGHELRTPLGLVKGYVELLLSGDLGDLLDDQQDALKVVRACTDNLERLINNLMMLQ
ncbi:MAG: GAF domain-containing protein, partial [Anaerolineae bacterium]